MTRILECFSEERRADHTIQSTVPLLQLAREWTPVTTSIFIVAYLVIDQQLNGIVPPFNQDYLVGLSWHTIGEWRAYAWAGTGFEPHAHSEGVHFREALLDAPVQVVGTEREGHLEILRWFEGIVTCWWTTSSVSAMEIHFIHFQCVWFSKAFVSMYIGAFV